MFEPYDPAPSPHLHRIAYQVRAAHTTDVAAVAELWHAREPLGPARPHDVARWLADANEVVLVAQEERGVGLLGYGRASLQSERPGCPGGWYLTGLVVAPEARRQGVGRSLTQARLEQHRARGAERCRCVTNADNLSSIALHTELGFEIEAELDSFPGVRFEGGRGALYLISLR